VGFSVEGLAQVIADLPETDQLILSLRYEQGLSMRQIAHVLDLPERDVCRMHDWLVEEVLHRSQIH
jgi:DNA-directed RNA polymerase specialized sigma subunit